MGSEREMGDEAPDMLSLYASAGHHLHVQQQARKARKGALVYFNFKAVSIDRCNVCGVQASNMRKLVAKRFPVTKTSGFYVSADHQECMRRAREQRYEEILGWPGDFPAVCAGCPYRAEAGHPINPHYECCNPARKEAGGAGLRAKRSADRKYVSACSGRAT